jgi:hypothetical protein
VTQPDKVFTGFTKPDGAAPKCMVTMTLQGKSRMIEDDYSCQNYHGVSCACDGTLQKTRGRGRLLSLAP